MQNPSEEFKCYCDTETTLKLIELGFPTMFPPTVYKKIRIYPNISIYEAAAWLRTKEIWIEINTNFFFGCDSTTEYSIRIKFRDRKASIQDIKLKKFSDTYEDALERGIKYAIKLLERKNLWATFLDPETESWKNDKEICNKKSNDLDISRC